MGATAEMSCSHHINDQDAAMISGLCPLCLKAERDKLRTWLGDAEMTTAKLRAVLSRIEVCDNAVKGEPMTREDMIEIARRALEESK